MPVRIDDDGKRSYWCGSRRLGGRFQMASYTVTLSEAETIPATLDVESLAEEAFQAGFKVIADGITDALGGKTWGDVDPLEVYHLSKLYQACVRTMLLNNTEWQKAERVRATLRGEED